MAVTLADKIAAVQYEIGRARHYSKRIVLYEHVAALKAVLADLRTIEARLAEPFLPADLLDADEGEPEKLSERSVMWHIKALHALADQLGLGNDFYFPLRGAAEVLAVTNCGMFRALEEMDRARAESADARRAGAEAMRERAAKLAEQHWCYGIPAAIRALPVEELDGPKRR